MTTTDVSTICLGHLLSWLSSWLLRARITALPSRITFEISIFLNNVPLFVPKTSACLIGGTLHLTYFCIYVSQIQSIPDSDIGWEDMCHQDNSVEGKWVQVNSEWYKWLGSHRGKKSEHGVMVMHCRCSSTRGYVQSEDLEQEAQSSGAMDRRTAGAATRALQPPLQLIPSSRRPRAFSTHSNCSETRQEHWAEVVRRAHSKSERVVVRIALQ